MDVISSTIDDRELQDLFNRLQKRFSDTQPVLTKIGAMYERRVLENFDQERSPDGTPWQPLSAVTIMLGLSRRKGFLKSGGLSEKGKRYLKTKKILRESGDLESSIHFQVSGNQVSIGSSGSIVYAAIQQLGGKAGRGHKVKILAREYLGINDGGELALAEQDKSWIMALVREELLEFD